MSRVVIGFTICLLTDLKFGIKAIFPQNGSSVFLILMGKVIRFSKKDWTGNKIDSSDFVTATIFPAVSI